MPTQTGGGRGWVAVAAGLVLILLGGFQPWVRSGRAWRDGYEVVRTADRLGLVGNGVQGAAAALWYLVPLLCGITLAAVALDRRALAHAGSMVVAAIAAAMAIVVLRSPLHAGRGVTLVLVGAALVAAGSIWVVVRRRSAPVRPVTEGLQRGVTREPGAWRRNAR